MNKVQPKTGELIQMLSPSLVNGENRLSEFEIHYIQRNAKHLPDLNQSLSIQGLLKIVCGEVDEGCDLCERAIALGPNEAASLINYTLALRSIGYHKKNYDAYRRATRSVEPAILRDVTNAAVFWVDLEILDEVIPVIEAMDLPFDDDIEHAAKLRGFLHELGGEGRDLQRIAKIMMGIADNGRILLDVSKLDFLEDDTLALMIKIAPEDASLLSDMNNQLVDALLSEELEMSKFIGLFVAGD
ncbi:hypothetical protein QQF21_17250 [Lelliottia sp. V89_10]|nr:MULTISPECIES: hypothetical protein [unclassified Lelliottia]MDI3359780.1 hypothetical protein [Lelliottia sp. V89_13]MDK9548738.1 hypothetical protein [Lelliottia sp. V89_5]MDK9597370.1 hypothetical protein [Lelliottia sp. V89_10]